MPQRKSNKKKDPNKLTLRQSRFAKAFMTAKTAKDAALAAGLSQKYPAQAAYQMLQQLQGKKIPEVMNALGFDMPNLIYKYLSKILDAKETKFAIEDGKFSDHVEVENLELTDRGLDKAFRLHGAYAPRDPKEAAQVGVKVIVVDVPRPTPGAITDDIRPGQPIILPPRNGHKPQE